MSNTKLNGLVFSATVTCCLLMGAGGASAQTVTQIISTNFEGPSHLAVDGSGNVYVTTPGTYNAFRITPELVITEIIDATGDGGDAFYTPYGIAVDGAGNVYVDGGQSRNVLKITPEGVISEIIGATGDGTHALGVPSAIAADGAGNVYVGGEGSNVFKITPEGVISVIMDATGDGTHAFGGPRDIAVDGAGNIYVTGPASDNAFKITPEGGISEIIDATGDATHALDAPHDIAVDGAGNVYVTGYFSDNAFKITQDGVISEIINSTGDGTRALHRPRFIATDAVGNVYVTGSSDNMFKITPEGVISEIINRAGDGRNWFGNPGDIAADGAGNVYVTGRSSNNVFKITLEGVISEIIPASGDAARVLYTPSAITMDNLGNVYVTGRVSDNVFKITPQGDITEIIAAGYGEVAFWGLYDTAVDGVGNVYVTAWYSHNALKVTPEGEITEIIDRTGDGSNALSYPSAIAMDGLGNVYVTGSGSDNAFKITPQGDISEIIDAAQKLAEPSGIAVDGAGNVYVSGEGSDNVFKITPAGVITEIIGAAGDGMNALASPNCIEIDGLDNVYVTGSSSSNAFKITPQGDISEIIDASGDGIHTLNGTRGIAVDGAGNVFVSAGGGNRAFKITPEGVVTEIIDTAGDGVNAIRQPWGIAVDGAGNVYVTGSNSDNVFKISFNLFVDADATGANDGSSWADAYTDLQDALADAAVTPVDIWVAGGVYTPAPPGGDRNVSFDLLSVVAIRGGFAGTEARLHERVLGATETILSGDLDGDDVPSDFPTGPSRWENSYHVVAGGKVDSSALLEGFTITGGNANGAYPDNFGGGMHNSSGASPTISHCRFYGNTASGGGAGLEYHDSSSKVADCSFVDNWTSGSGGGVHNYGGGPTFDRCVFAGNWASTGGGAVDASYGGDVVMTNCAFTGNVSPAGAALWIYDSVSMTVTNCSFSDNTSAAGAAFGIDSDAHANPSDIQVANSILWNGGNEVWNNDGSTITITYSDVEDDDPNDAVVYPGTGNIDDDPFFVNADGPDGAAGTEDDDLRLASCSPLLDVGNNTPAGGLPATDLNGYRRVINGTVDLGPYEYVGRDPTAADCNGNGIADVCDSDDLTSTDCNGNGMPDRCDVALSENAKLTASDAAEEDSFGSPVSINGYTALVGAPYDGDNGDHSGSAYVYRYDGTTWTEEIKLTASDATARDRFGYSVSISGDTAVVGAPYDGDNGDYSGSAYVFRYNGANWVEEAKLTASDGAASDYLGSSVSISGDAAIIGALWSEGSVYNSGSAYVFRYSGSSWTEEAKLAAPDGAEADVFGSSVSISGDTAVVGAPQDDDNGDRSGSAYVFRYNGTTWVEEAKLTTSDGAEGDTLGGSVSISGDTLLVGAYGTESYSGSAYVFRYSGSSWVEETKLTASDAALFDRFGNSVSISGDTAVVGAAQDDDNGNRSGSAYVFRYNGSSWVEEKKLTASDGAARDRFGDSVSISGDVAIIGAYYGDGTVYNSGSAYIYAPLASDCNNNYVPDGCEIDLSSGAPGGPFYCDPAAPPGGLGQCDADTDGNGVPDACDCANAAAVSLPLSNPSTTDVGYGTTPRFISFLAGVPGRQQAIRVSMPDPMPSPYEAWSGLQMWVGPPTRYCENSGNTAAPSDTPPNYGCDAAPGLPQRTYMASTLQCEPYYMDWHGVCDGGTCLGGLRDGQLCGSDPECSEAIYVFHEGIIPSAGPHNAATITPTTYGVQVIDEVCDRAVEGDYSTALTLTTSKWGDTVENTGTSPFPPPEGIIQITDVLAILAKFQNLGTASISARVDLLGAVAPKYLVDHGIDIGDVLQVLFAFQAVKYPSPAITGVPNPRPCP